MNTTQHSASPNPETTPTSAAKPDPVWPSGRGDQVTFAHKHGAQLAERFLVAFYQGDPVADALFTSATARKDVMRQVRRALSAGAAEPGDAPEVHAFIDDLRAAVEPADWAAVERGRRAYLTIPAPVHAVALGPGSLIHTYSTPAISAVLTRTGRLVDTAVRRLLDTASWEYHLFADEDALRPGGQGFADTGMVRAMHAYSRAQDLQAGRDTSVWGLPINAIDMLRTWFDFTYVPYRALAGLGYDLADEQVHEVYGLWQVVGRMLGIPADLLEPNRDHVSSEPLVQAIAEVDGDPDDGSRALSEALLSAVGVQNGQITGLDPKLHTVIAEVQVRMIHGDEVADALGIPHHPEVQAAETLHIPTVAGRFALLQENPVALEREIAGNQEFVRQLLAQTADGKSAHETVPVG
ncbi:DUF2236 domain-containing protein [Brevibacterium sp. 50QC2O2]|uniref:oxygenase MpaB family protein n=1 Tax=Brevibacterium TaxID=1696 RepID=UPI00211BBDF5|nr:DUF2236 domain-containing protein [Brevibacterium sp. 91QC2O2]MCQ9386962.1 DUF2236 domain-containing protein [Brevibacterium sp. 68QC2CO]MCQ9389922.1 DUF2236 domain-containing protein [Brevibacterium sp. 50QC2O2]